MKKTIIAGLFLIGLGISSQAQKAIPLYKGLAPGTENWKQKEAQQFNELFKTEVVFNVTQPSILVYEANKAKANGTVVIVAPGGGFQSLSINREGIEVAKKLAENGITAVVLKYRLLETKSNDPATEMMASIKDRAAFDKRTAPIKVMAGEDIKTAITYVRSHAKELNVNPDKLGVIGFSAGASVILESVLHSKDTSTLPNFAASMYGGPSDEVMASEMPSPAVPLFICVAADDQLKLAPKSIALYNKWYQAGQPTELHVYEKGGHGFGMGKQNLPVDNWSTVYLDWLKFHKFL